MDIEYFNNTFEEYQDIYSDTEAHICYRNFHAFFEKVKLLNWNLLVRHLVTGNPVNIGILIWNPLVRNMLGGNPLVKNVVSENPVVREVLSGNFSLGTC